MFLVSSNLFYFYFQRPGMSRAHFFGDLVQPVRECFTIFSWSKTRTAKKTRSKNQKVVSPDSLFPTLIKTYKYFGKSFFINKNVFVFLKLNEFPEEYFV